MPERFPNHYWAFVPLLHRSQMLGSFWFFTQLLAIAAAIYLFQTLSLSFPFLSTYLADGSVDLAAELSPRIFGTGSDPGWLRDFSYVGQALFALVAAYALARFADRARAVAQGEPLASRHPSCRQVAIALSFVIACLLVVAVLEVLFRYAFHLHRTLTFHPTGTIETWAIASSTTMRQIPGLLGQYSAPSGYVMRQVLLCMIVAAAIDPAGRNRDQLALSHGMRWLAYGLIGVATVLLITARWLSGTALVGGVVLGLVCGQFAAWWTLLVLGLLLRADDADLDRAGEILLPGLSLSLVALLLGNRMTVAAAFMGSWLGGLTIAGVIARYWRDDIQLHARKRLRQSLEGRRFRDNVVRVALAATPLGVVSMIIVNWSSSSQKILFLMIGVPVALLLAISMCWLWVPALEDWLLGRPNRNGIDDRKPRSVVVTCLVYRVWFYFGLSLLIWIMGGWMRAPATSRMRDAMKGCLSACGVDGEMVAGALVDIGLAVLVPAFLRLVAVLYYPALARSVILSLLVSAVGLSVLATAFPQQAALAMPQFENTSSVITAILLLLGGAIATGLIAEMTLKVAAHRWGRSAGDRCSGAGVYRCVLCGDAVPVFVARSGQKGYCILQRCPKHPFVRYNLRRETASWVSIDPDDTDPPAKTAREDLERQIIWAFPQGDP